MNYDDILRQLSVSIVAAMRAKPSRDPSQSFNKTRVYQESMDDGRLVVVCHLLHMHSLYSEWLVYSHMICIHYKNGNLSAS